MKTIKLTAATGVLSVVLLLNVPNLLAQDEPPAIPPAPAAPANSAAPGAPSASPAGDTATRGADRREQFRQKMNEVLKTSLKASDEEWSIIQPLLEKVQIKQREVLIGRFNFPGGRPGGGRPDRPDRPDRPASPEADALKAALESDATSAADIKAKLEAVRAARKKAAAELEQAREDLRKVLTQRQEATLVMVGILE